MRLYTRTGATALTDPESGVHYEADADGAFEFPEELGEQLRRFHVSKQPMWEDSIERQRRLMDEEMERAKDPATLLAVVQQLAQLAQLAQGVQASAPESAPSAEGADSTPVAKQARKRAATKPPAVE